MIPSLQSEKCGRKNGGRSIAKQPLQDVTNIINRSVQGFYSNLQSLTSLPPCLANWHMSKFPDGIEISQLTGSPPTVKFNLTIQQHLSWAVTLYGQLIASVNFLSKLPTTINSIDTLTFVCTSLEEAATCPGNDDSSFVKLL